MAKNKFSLQWLHDHINDPYVKMAQRDGYRARAAYKLKEIDEEAKLIKPGMIVVDLGSTPGSWSQYAREKMQLGSPNAKGMILALDMLPMEPIADVTFIQGDFREESVCVQLEEKLAGRKVDLVLSDMAPNLSGVASADAARMAHVVELALEFAAKWLKPEGALLTKSFHGSGHAQLVLAFKQQFVQVQAKKPKASRDKSAETFILGRKLKPL